jgi:hypothetical protein
MLGHRQWGMHVPSERHVVNFTCWAKNTSFVHGSTVQEEELADYATLVTTGGTQGVKVCRDNIGLLEKLLE